MKKTVIIQASSNSFGNTSKVVNYINNKNQFDVIDLKTKTIGHFEYDFSNANDDFLSLMEKITTNYDAIVFVTPVYWYTMSGILKVFFDRLSDLLHYRKELGKKLIGKKMGFISNSGENDRREGFEMPFVESAKYLGMEFLGNTHVWFSEDEIADKAKLKLDEFKKLFS